MKTEIDDGGPAFPETRWDDKTRQDVQWTGMSLRDYFAAKALAGAFASDCEGFWFNGDYGSRAEVCYKMADAMLKARSAQ